MMAPVLLWLSCSALFLLPLVPAIKEWLRPTDAQPLNVVREHGGHISHFANSFQRFVNSQLRPILERASTGQAQVDEVLPDGTKVIALPSASTLQAIHQSTGDQETEALILAAGDLTLPGDHTFTGEVYVEGSLHSGSGLVLRAVLAKGDIHLGSEAYVLRWLHADGQLVAGENCKLYGRASASQRVTLSPGCFFTRIHAPHIEFIPANLLRGNSAPPSRRFEMPKLLQSSSNGRWLMRGNLTVTANTWHKGHLIASEDLQVGTGAFVSGAIKGRDVVLEAGCRVHGSVVARERVIMERDSHAMGPIVAEHVVEIGPGCVVGAPDQPTTITAPSIRVAPGAVVHGLIWAREEGRVLS